MATNVTKLEDNKVRIDVEVPPEAVRKGVEAKVRELRRKVRVPGFRPGKAPRRMIENRLGRDYIYMEALQESLPAWYSSAVVENNLQPIDKPEIHFDNPLDEQKGFKFSATVNVRPEAKLNEYKGLEVPRREVKITEEQVEEALEKVREQFATLVAVEGRPVQEGDFVILDYKGERMTGGALEDGEAEDYMLKVGSGELLEDFEKNLIGMHAGERKQFGVTFPIDYDEEALRGQSVLFRTYLKEIKEKELPPVDDEFAKEASEFETIEEFRSAVREQLATEAEQRVEGDFRARVLEAVTERADVEVPEVMVEEKAQEMVESFERSIRMQGIEPEHYYQLAGSGSDEVKERVRDDALDAVKKELILDAVVRAEGIASDEASVMQQIHHLAQSSDRPPEEIVEIMRKNGTYRLLEEEIARQKALGFLVENAVPIPVSEQEEAEGSGNESSEVPVQAENRGEPPTSYTAEVVTHNKGEE
jgi:trigger factor